jgi:hypothetical protein
MKNPGDAYAEAVEAENRDRSAPWCWGVIAVAVVFVAIQLLDWWLAGMPMAGR